MLAPLNNWLWLSFGGASARACAWLRICARRRAMSKACWMPTNPPPNPVPGHTQGLARIEETHGARSQSPQPLWLTRDPLAYMAHQYILRSGTCIKVCGSRSGAR